MEDLKKQMETLLARTQGLVKLEKTVEEINNRLKNVEETLRKEVSDLKNRVGDLEKSQQFISKQYEGHKKTNENLIKRDTALDNENKQLNSRINSLNEELEQERAARNADAQHLRSSLHVKVCGIPMQDGEETRDASQANNTTTSELVTKLAIAAKFEKFDPSQIDVCHRTSNENPNSPIIIRFKSKNERSVFFSQRKNLQDLKLEDLGIEEPEPPVVDPSQPAARGGLRGGGRGGGPGRRAGGRNATDENDRPRVFLQEALTEYNTVLLKEAKIAASALQYKFAGYVYNGQVRVKLSEGAKFIPIRSKFDLNNIK